MRINLRLKFSKKKNGEENIQQSLQGLDTEISILDTTLRSI